MRGGELHMRDCEATEGLAFDFAPRPGVKLRLQRRVTPMTLTP